MENATSAVATVFISLPLRKYTAGQQQVVVEGKTLRELVDNLDASFTGIKEQIVREGRLRPGLSAVVDGRPTRRGLLQPIGEESEIHFLPSIAGGSFVDYVQFETTVHETFSNGSQGEPLMFTMNHQDSWERRWENKSP